MTSRRRKPARPASSSRRLVIYGATGFTGRLLANHAAATGLDPLLSGRNPERLGEIAAETGLLALPADLADSIAMDAILSGASVVINAAGPFDATAAPLMQACLRNGVHYLDVSGEAASYEAAGQFAAAARNAGVMLLPGVGFGVVATDCLAVRAARRRPDATHLRIALTLPAVFSQGSLQTMIAMVRSRVMVRSAGQLVGLRIGSRTRSFDFGQGSRVCTLINWPDPVTAYRSTGIPNIETYAEAGLLTRAAYWAGARLAPTPWDLMAPLVRSATRLVERSPPEAGLGTQSVVAETEDPWRRVGRLRLTTMDAYRFTEAVAVIIARRVMAGEFRPGFETPGGLFGDALLDEVDGIGVESLA